LRILEQSKTAISANGVGKSDIQRMPSSVKNPYLLLMAECWHKEINRLTWFGIKKAAFKNSRNALLNIRAKRPT
jgi:hypothetical protein